jgi:putative ABC transport system permease protein
MPREGVTRAELKDELTGVMRSIRRLKPGAEDNFAINEISIISQMFDGFFSALAIIGWVIGGFSLLVGGFGIANIMFVSVRERTGIIGIQKALKTILCSPSFFPNRWYWPFWADWAGCSSSGS